VTEQKNIKITSIRYKKVGKIAKTKIKQKNKKNKSKNKSKNKKQKIKNKKSFLGGGTLRILVITFA
jgi:hypothetical protein